MDDNPPCLDELCENGFVEADLEYGTMILQGTPQLSLQDKAGEANLDSEGKENLSELLSSFGDLFDGHLGRTSLTERVIVTGDAKPVNLPPYRTSPAKKQIIEEQKMLQDNIIEPASGPWAAPVVIVNKPPREPRFCVDFRGLNQLTVKDSYSLPRVDESLDFLSRGKFLTTLDLARAGLIYKSCVVYLDDIVVASPTFEQHLLDLKEVLGRLQSAGLSLKLSKCQFCLSELTFLGYRVTPAGIHPDPDKVRAVTEFKVPTTTKQVRQFLGLTGYYRRFVQDYARHAESLFALTKKDVQFHWDDKCQAAVDFLKHSITSAPVLRFPDFSRPFFIHTDACDAGLGAALMQKDEDGKDVAVAFASRAMHKSEKPYSTPEKECLAVIWALEHFRPYVEGLHVIIYTDHSSLKWLMSRPNPSGRLARWSLRLQDFDFSIIHKPGERNKVPDALSRNPLPDVDAPIDLLPPYAVIGSMDLRALPSVIVSDRPHVCQLQLEDPVTGSLLKQLESDQRPGEDNQDLEKYVVHDGLLYFLDPKMKCGLHPLKQLKLFAPTTLRGYLLKYYHDHPTAGHLGIAKTLARLRLRFFWPHMNSDVKKYVVSCCSCQATKPSQRKTAGLMVPIQPQRPWEYAGVDYVGPLPRTQRGNAYILVFVDYFSKWIEVSAVREATAQVAANKFITDIFARHGSTSYLISDRGTPFVSELFEHVLLTLGTEHRLTTAYHPQTNATERVNCTLKTAIRAYVGDKHTSWDKYLPQICFALRTAPHESTGLSPSMMLYGRELDTPLDLVTQPSWEGLSDPETSYSADLRASLRDAHEHARLVLEESHKRQKHYYDLRRRTVSHEVGDLVRVKSHPKSDASSNFSAKLAPLYTGPYRISKRMSDVNYCLTTVDTGEKVGVFHVANLQPFYTWASALSGKHAKLKAAAALDLSVPGSSLPPALSVPGRNDCDAVDATPAVFSDTPAETDFDCTDTVPLFVDQNSFQETADIALGTEVNSSPPADNGCAVRGRVSEATSLGTSQALQGMEAHLPPPLPLPVADALRHRCVGGSLCPGMGVQVHTGSLLVAACRGLEPGARSGHFGDGVPSASRPGARSLRHSWLPAELTGTSLQPPLASAPRLLSDPSSRTLLSSFWDSGAAAPLLVFLGLLCSGGLWMSGVLISSIPASCPGGRGCGSPHPLADHYMKDSFEYKRAHAHRCTHG
ncbi:unnamed protein product [Oreochromis niloticus]|nr:unnamed protein product [Mustela putorius furo]